VSDIMDMLSKARDHNSEMGLSGFLVFDKDYFVQVLEGFEPVVKDLIKRIYSDSRHENIRTICEGKVDELLFTKWKMAHFTGDDLPPDLSGKGFNPMDMDELEAKSLLHHFRSKCLEA
jgi:hypothetical protein